MASKRANSRLGAHLLPSAADHLATAQSIVGHRFSPCQQCGEVKQPVFAAFQPPLTVCKQHSTSLHNVLLRSAGTTTTEEHHETAHPLRPRYLGPGFLQPSHPFQYAGLIPIPKDSVTLTESSRVERVRPSTGSGNWRNIQSPSGCYGNERNSYHTSCWFRPRPATALGRAA